MILTEPHSTHKKPRGNTLQRAQRAANRAKVLEAALEAFADKGYANATVEDVIRGAGVSRATFYANFAGKVGVLDLIADNFAPVWTPLWDELTAMPDYSLNRLRPWCARHVEIYREHHATCIIITQGAAIERSFYNRLALDQERIIDRLATAPRLSHLTSDADARTRAALALGQIDNACYFLAVRRRKADPTAGIDVMANLLLHFFEREQQIASPA